MPFGKYTGMNLTEIPLGYLDMTVSVMPPTWVIRRVQEFVDTVMDLPCAPLLPGNQTFYELHECWLAQKLED